MTGSPRLLAVVVLVGALGVGVVLASLLVAGGGRPGSSPSPSPVAQASPSASAAPPSPSSSPVTSPSVLPAGSPSGAPAATPTAGPSTPPGDPASITFSALKLDAADDPDGQDRVLTFVAEGAGTVAIRLASVSPRGETVVCLRSGDEDLGCRTTADGTISAPTSEPRLAFTLTLRGDGVAAPVVDVALTFPARSPAVTIDHARFDGTAYPETNGIDASLTPRADGPVRVVAQWGGHPLLYDIGVREQGGSGAQELRDQGPAPGTDTRLAVVAPNPWRLVLANAEEGFGVTPMTATIAWP